MILTKRSIQSVKESSDSFIKTMSDGRVKSPNLSRKGEKNSETLHGSNSNRSIPELLHDSSSRKQADITKQSQFQENVGNSTPSLEKDNRWNENIEQNIKNLAEMAIAYKWMHIHAARRFTKRFNFLMNTAIILTGIDGVLNVVRLTVNDNTAMAIIAPIISFIVASILSVIKFRRYDELAYNHKTYAGKYTGIISNARRQLTMFRKDREYAPDYLAWYSYAFDDIFESAPLIQTGDQKAYEDFAMKRGIAIPEEYDIFSDKFIDELCNNENIVIRISGKDDDVSEEHLSSYQASTRNKTMRRENTNSKEPLYGQHDSVHQVQPRNRFSDIQDAKMRYEMKRFMRNR